MFGARRKKRPSEQQQLQQTQQQQGGNPTNVVKSGNNNLVGVDSSSSPSSLTQQHRYHHNDDQTPVLDMMRNKAHAQHPHSKDMEEQPQQQRQQQPSEAIGIAKGGESQTQSEEYIIGDDEYDDDGSQVEEEEEDNASDEDDDLFEFMPPNPAHLSQSHPYPNSHPDYLTQMRAPPTAVSRGTTSAGAGVESSLLPPHHLETKHHRSNAQNAQQPTTGNTTETTATDASIATEDIAALPFIAMSGDPASRLGLETPPSLPQSAAGASSQDIQYTTTIPRSNTLPNLPPGHNDETKTSSVRSRLRGELKAGPTPTGLSDAQRLAYQYQSGRPIESRSGAATAAVNDSRSDSPDAQYVMTASTGSDSNNSAYGGAGPHKRKQPYKYPGSPVYQTQATTTTGSTPGYGAGDTPTSMSRRVNDASRLDTPVIELADANTSHKNDVNTSNAGRDNRNHRPRQSSNMTLTSYPPEYGMHPDDRRSPPESMRRRAANVNASAYSKHYVDIPGSRRTSAAYERGHNQQSSYQQEYDLGSPETLRNRRHSKHFDDFDYANSKAGGTAEGDSPRTPDSKDDGGFGYTMSDLISGMERGGMGYESKDGIGIGIQSRDGGIHYPTSGRYATEDGMDETAVGSNTPGTLIGGGSGGGIDGLGGEGKDSFQQFELEDEEDSPYPEVRASVSNIDDPEMPCLTFRTWFIGMLFTICGGALNLFFSIRLPAPLMTPLTVQIISYPLGKFLAYILPTTTYRTPRWLTILGLPTEWSLNPGPFNIKEHAIVVIMINVSIAPSYAIHFTFALDKFYNIRKGSAFDFLCLLTTNIVGFSFAGLCRRYLVWPASLVWPQNLVTCTLFNTFHAEDDDGSDGSLTRFKYFSYVFIGAAIWFILPGFLFTALSVFSFICWMAPQKKVVNQLFGVSTGLGMSLITLDWSQIAYTGSPLIVPWWAEVNVFVGFVLLYWIMVPILYYTNTWNFSYMPISASGNFDRFGQFYNVTNVITPDITLDENGYRAYSMLFMSTTYATVYALSLCLSTAAIVHTVLHNGKEIYLKFKNAHTEMEDVHAKLMRNYPEVPDYWYWILFVVCVGLGIVTIEIFDTQLPVWCFLISLLVGALYVLPGGYIFAMTAQLITVNLIAEIIPGYALPGKPIANMLFKTFSVQCLQSALYFVQDLKVGHYMKIPPRITFMVQLIATVVSCGAQTGFKRVLENLVPDLCTQRQAALLSCPVASVTYEASIIWGVIGPSRFFGGDSLYRPILYMTILGAFLPIPFFLYAKSNPRSWVKYVNIPVLLNGATYIPPATGINYSSWFAMSFIFQYLLRRFRFRWWSKFSFITSAALEGGTVLSAIFIFFALQLPRGNTIQPDWWGNNVYKKTDDWFGIPFKEPPQEGFGPTTWS